MIGRILVLVRKEILLLLRDRAGLALLYLMPVALVSIMAVVQDAPFRDFSDKQVKVLFRDQDHGPVGEGLYAGLAKLGSFDIVRVPETELSDDAGFTDKVRRGDFQVGLTVPAGATAAMQSGAAVVVGGILPTDKEITPVDTVSVHLLIDPAMKHAFRALVRGSVMRVLASLSSEHLLVDLRLAMERMTGMAMEPLKAPEPFVGITQEMAAKEMAGDRVAFDSTQHNVPAWTIFAMFFTVVLLAGNMVKERNSGCMIRLLTMPGGTGERIAGRMLAYLLVGITQAILLLFVGVAVLPLFGMPPLVLPPPSALLLLGAVVLVVGTAATAFGVLIGSISNTQQRSAVLGSTTVVIFSAIGGIWVPLYIMPERMQQVGSWSPLHWSMEAFNTVLLRQGGGSELFPFLAPLLIFSMVCIVAAITAEHLAYRR